MGQAEKKIFSSWDEVLDVQAEWLLEEFQEHKDAANIEYFFPNYKSILERICEATDDYTEYDDVAEEFSYSQEEWMEKISVKFKPIIKEWFENFCLENKDADEYVDYIETFWT